MTPDEIEERLLEAIQTLAALPDRERKWLHARGAAWPEPLREAVDVMTQAFDRIRAGKSAYEALPPPRVTPTADAITRMDDTLPWLQWLDHDERRILTLRAFDMMWIRIAWRFKTSVYFVKKRYYSAIFRVGQILAGKISPPGFGAREAPPTGRVLRDLRVHHRAAPAR